MFQNYILLSRSKLSGMAVWGRFRTVVVSFYSRCTLTRLSAFFLDRTAWFFEFVAGLVVVVGLALVVALLLWYGVFKFLLGFIFFFVVVVVLFFWVSDVGLLSRCTTVGGLLGWV